MSLKPGTRVEGSAFSEIFLSWFFRLGCATWGAVFVWMLLSFASGAWAVWWFLVPNDPS